MNGTKLWATNGAIADVVVVMAKVPKSDGHRGGITAFVVEADAPGVTHPPGDAIDDRDEDRVDRLGRLARTPQC